MSLAGRMDSFPLPEVLRLLARAAKSGCLEVGTADTEGRLYLVEGKLNFATTRQHDMGEQAIAAGLVSRREWIEVERREKTMTEVLKESRSEADLVAFVRELVTDVVFRLAREMEGEFEFKDEVSPPYETGQRIDPEEVLAETELRIEQWRDIEAAIPGIGFGLRMARELTGTRDVTLTGEAWRILAALEGVGSIADVAHRLGSSDFQVGRVLAGLVREGLVEVVDEDRTATAAYYYGELEDPVPMETSTPELEDPQPEALAEPDEADQEQESEPALFRRRRGIGALKLDEE